jgi:hypothetical protein
MDSNIKFIAVGRIEGTISVAHYYYDKSKNDKYIHEMNQFMQSQANSMVVDLKQVMHSDYGQWNMIVDKYYMSYLVLTKQGYPERHISGLFHEL